MDHEDSNPYEDHLEINVLHQAEVQELHSDARKIVKRRSQA